MQFALSRNCFMLPNVRITGRRETWPPFRTRVIPVRFIGWLWLSKIRLIVLYLVVCFVIIGAPAKRCEVLMEKHAKFRKMLLIENVFVDDFSKKMNNPFTST